MRTVYMRVRRAMTPPTEDHRPALRVALGLAIPGVALLAAGRPDLIIYAVFGAITGMYGRTETRSRRFAHQTQGGVILVLGVAYKRDITDWRESPAAPVITGLLARGGRVDYQDDFVPEFWLGHHGEDGEQLKSVPLDYPGMAEYDCVVIVTDHSYLDAAQVVQHARRVVDTRNLTRSLGDDSAKVVKL